MQDCHFRVAVILIVAFVHSVFADSASPKPAFKSNLAPGKFVLLTEPNAGFQDDNGRTTAGEAGKLYRVEQIQGSKLRVQGQPGWISASSVTDAESAVVLFTKRLYQRPDVNDYLSRAQAYAATGRFRRAIADYDAVLVLNPNSKLAHTGRGNCFQSMQDLKAAAADYTAALKLDPDFASARNNRGNVYRALGNFEQALADYNAAIQAQPNSVSSQFGRGICLAALDQHAEAIQAFDQVTTQRPNHADALNERGLSWQKLGKHEKALASYDRAVQANTNHYESFNNLAWLLANSKQKELRNPVRALKAADHACKITGYRNWYCLGTLAVAFARNGDMPKAVEAQTRALQSMPKQTPKADREDYQNRLKLYVAASKKR